MIKLRFLIIITFFLSACGLTTVKNKDFIDNNIPYLKNGDSAKISNKSEKHLQFGCIVETTTQGAFELEKILNDSGYFNSDNDKRLLCISIIKNINVYFNREVYHISVEKDTT